MSIINNDQFRNILKKGLLEYKTKPRLIFKECGDIHPKNLKFPDAESICFYRCDKNFVYYWMNKCAFPKLKQVDMLSHPCEPHVFRREIPIRLGSNWSHYMRWVHENDPVDLMLSSDEHGIDLEVEVEVEV